jgi:hypothetical protein
MVFSGWFTGVCSLNAFNTRKYTKFRMRREFEIKTISFVISIRPSFRMEQLGSNWKDYHIVWCLRIYRKSVDKIKVSSKSDKNKEYVTWRQIYIFIKSRLFLFGMWNVSKLVEKIKTHILCPITFFPENRAVYEVMRKNTVEKGSPLMTIWRLRIACWISNAADTYTQVV